MSNEPILIIDDHAGNLKLTQIALDKMGYETRTASTAQEALNVLETFKPKVILMDLQLPGVSGFQLTQQIKSEKKYEDIIIIAVTAYAMKGDKEKALAAGCDGYIAKPIDIDVLPNIINQYLAKTSA